MFRIKTMNSISPAGIEALTARGCDVSADEVRPEALLLRSAELHGCEFNPELLAIGRAGAGYNIRYAQKTPRASGTCAAI